MLVLISSFLLAGVITLIAIQLTQIARPRFSNFNEYAMYIFGFYKSDAKRAIGEKYVTFYVCVFFAAFFVCLYLISALASYFLPP